MIEDFRKYISSKTLYYMIIYVINVSKINPNTALEVYHHINILDMNLKLKYIINLLHFF